MYIYIYLTEAQTWVYLKKYRHIVAIFEMKKIGIFKNMAYSYNGMLQINKMNTALIMNRFLKNNIKQKSNTKIWIIWFFDKSSTISKTSLWFQCVRNENHIASEKERVLMKQVKGVFWDSGHLLCIYMERGDLDVFTCENALSCLLMTCLFFYMCVLLSLKC